MSKTARKRIPLDVLRADENALFGLRTIEGYQPPNENFTLPVINAAYKRYKDTQEAEARLEKALAAARDESIEAEHAFHNGVGGSSFDTVMQICKVLGIKAMADDAAFYLTDDTEQLLTQYAKLDEYGRHTVATVLKVEADRCAKLRDLGD